MAKGKNSYIRRKNINTLLKINYCQYCGSKNNLCIDHYIPVSKGGDSMRSNLIRACINCNSSKSDRMPIDWLKHLVLRRDELIYELNRINNSINYLMDREEIL